MPLHDQDMGARSTIGQRNSDPGPTKNPYRLDGVTERAAQLIGFTNLEAFKTAYKELIEKDKDKARFLLQEACNVSSFLETEKDEQNPNVLEAIGNVESVVQQWKDKNLIAT